MIGSAQTLPLIQHYIDGRFVSNPSHRYELGINPATATPFYRLDLADETLVQQAVTAAQQAFNDWSSLAAKERAHYLNALADCVEQRLELFAELEAQDTGKPLSLARRVDIPRSIDNLRFFAASALQFASESHNSQQEINYTLRAPCGVVATISPWNLPLYLLTWKIAPALAMGNTVVAKPSELTPLTANELAKCCIEIGLPPGVLNILHGTGTEVGEKIALHPQVKAVSFTGSTRTGVRLASQLAPQFKKYSLELGGKNAAVIFADCDWEKMLETVVRSSFSNQGQICLCTSRLLIDKSIYEKFKIVFVERVKELRVGDPLAETTDIGAVISTTHQEKILSYIERAKQAGGKFLLSPQPLNLSGAFVSPTIIEGLDQNDPCNQEEIFGPVVTLQPFDDEANAIRLANAVDYGLCASVWTNDLTRAQRVSRDLTVGMVWVNAWLRRDLRTPFGGMKASGVGREGGLEVLRFFTEPKNICIPY